MYIIKLYYDNGKAKIICNTYDEANKLKVAYENCQMYKSIKLIKIEE